MNSFFRATEHERWRDAARLMDLGDFDALRRETVRDPRHPRTPHPVTREELVQADPKMPRAVAEYQAARSNELIEHDDALLYEYANVATVDSLAALSPQEAAARWLQAKDPRYMMRRSLAAQQARCSLPDSLIIRLVSAPTSKVRVLGTVMADSLAYVLYYEVPAAAEDSVSAAGRGRATGPARRAAWVLPPPVLTLRRIGSHWRIVPGEPFGGWSGFAFVDCSKAKCEKTPATKADGDSVPVRLSERRIRGRSAGR